MLRCIYAGYMHFIVGLLEIIVTTLGAQPSCDMVRNCTVSESYGDPVWGSTVQTNSSADMAVDGVIQGQCFHSNIEPEPWWLVDLSELYYVCVIRIYLDSYEARLQGLGLPQVARSIRTSDMFPVDPVFCSKSIAATTNTLTLECGQTTVGRYVRIWRTTSYSEGDDQRLTLCEVDIFGYPHSQATSGDWECPSLLPTEPPETTTEPPETTTATTELTTTGEPVCTCPCDFAQMYLLSTALTNTSKPLEEKIEELVTELKVDKAQTSTAKAKLICVDDPRPSAKAVGYIGGAMLGVVFGGMLLMDSTYVIKACRKLYKKLNKVQKQPNKRVAA